MTGLIRQLELPGIDLDLSALDDWVKQFPEKEVRQALAEVRRQQDALNLLSQDLEERLAVYERLAHPMPDVRQPSAPRVEVLNGAGRGISDKRQAILQLLGRDPQRRFSVREIADSLVARGLMPPRDKKADKALSVMLASMIQRGEIHRPERAVYIFGPDGATRNEDPSTTSLQNS